MDKKTVLIVEDSPYLADSLSDMVELRGHHPVVALSGKEGVKQALELHPNLILLDIRLPDIDGYAVFNAIREDSWGKHANIMILTASESKENIMKNLDLPETKVLLKPDWSVPDLVKKIDASL